MPARACGATRIAGGVYLVCPLSQKGNPINDFLFDPPVVQDWNDMGVTEVGMKEIKDKDGVTHLLDVVGSNNYPNVADFIEEVRHHGLSRRISSKFKYKQLTASSRIILLHKRAHIENADEYPRIGRCIKNLNEHRASGPMCARLWWEDVEDGIENKEHREVLRVMPSLEYKGYCRPDGVKPKYVMAAFASFPIYGIEVINDPDGGRHVTAMESARKSSLSVNLVDE